MRRGILVLGTWLVAACGNGSGPSGNCDLSSATATTHDTIAGSETWASGVHRVPASLTIPVGATVTVAACSRVELGAGAGLTVNGTLVVAGTAPAPVTFVPQSSGQPWGTIKLNPGGSADLGYATLTGGGGSDPPASSATLGATIYVQGAGGPPPPAALKVTQVDVEQATGVGIALVNAAFAPASTGLVVHAAGSYPVYMGADVVGSLPDGSYTGNTLNAIALQTAFAAAQANERAIRADVTFHDRGVPYCVGMQEPGEIVIGVSGVAPPLVTVEPGVAIGFWRGSTSGGRIRILGDNSTNPTTALGALSALGTSDKPIVFGSCEATPAPGDWIGITMSGVDSRTRLEQVGIGYAGANSGVIAVCQNSAGTMDGDAALQILYQQGAPDSSFLVNSEITQSAANGVLRGWLGSDVDFLAGNVFTAIGWCAQTLVPDLSNACPATTCPTAP